MKNIRIQTSSFFESKESYLAFTAKWKALARAKKLTATDCLLRCILLGLDLEATLPVTKNTLRLANGAAENSGLARARSALLGATPLSAYARRNELIAKYQAGARPPADYILQRGWAEYWVTVERPESWESGLSLLTFELVQSSLRARTAT